MDGERFQELLQIQKYLGDKIEITITPDVGHFKKIMPKQGTYYFSSFNLTDNKRENTVVYNLEKRSVDDDIMIIEVSSCTGQFGYQVSNSLIFSNKETAPLYPTYQTTRFGKSVITLYPIPDDIDKFYFYLFI